jgi:hypothetical protein
MVIITNISQKIGVRSICAGRKFCVLSRRSESRGAAPRNLAPASLDRTFKPCAARNPTTAKMTPNCAQDPLIARRSHHRRDRKRRQNGADAIARGDEARRETALVGKPLHHVTHDADVDDSGLDSTQQSVREVEARHCCRLAARIQLNPARSAPDRQQQPRAEPVDQKPLSGRKKASARRSEWKNVIWMLVRLAPRVAIIGCVNSAHARGGSEITIMQIKPQRSWSHRLARGAATAGVEAGESAMSD